MWNLRLLQNMIISMMQHFFSPSIFKCFVFFFVRGERICMNLTFKCHPIVEAPREVGTGMKCCLGIPSSWSLIAISPER